MKNKISLKARRELVSNVRSRYLASSFKDKNKILDGFIAASGYQRKYAIALLNKPVNVAKKTRITFRRAPYYDQGVKSALVMIWQVANRICTKRLMPFIPELIASLERHGHLNISDIDRRKLASMSAATADRILKPERQKEYKNISHTRPGTLLKKQIQVRTFADWNDVSPGFFEGDLVAHCGGEIHGSFLNTFVLTDIATGWTEFMPLLCKNSANVINGMNAVIGLLPFPLLGLDTDNGSEFINYDLLDFCKQKEITFTRARARRSNDQAHVEEKNGSIVRRIIGYERFEGQEAWRALADLYAVLRLYINYFQPSLKLESKQRIGSKVTKKYDTAKTPYQRLLKTAQIDDDAKESMANFYKTLDPVNLLRELSGLQETFNKFAWQKQVDGNSKVPVPSNIIPINGCNNNGNKECNSTDKLAGNTIPEIKNKSSKKPRKALEPRTWRTRQDPFEIVWSDLQIKLELNPQETARSLLESLMKNQPNEFNLKHLRTLQRRVAAWRMRQMKQANLSHIQGAPERKKTFLALVLDGASG